MSVYSEFSHARTDAERYEAYEGMKFEAYQDILAERREFEESYSLEEDDE